MDPEKAIEILGIFRDEGKEDLPLDVEPAIQLGIEALEWKLALRKAKHPHGVKSLPSENHS